MHEEQNDALKRNIKIAIARYKFAINCLGAPKKVADLGSGMGYGSYMMTHAGHLVTGYDKSDIAIEYAKENYHGIEFNCLEIEYLELINFDAVVCLETLCHMKQPKKFIKSLYENSHIRELIISSPIDPDKDDGYFYRLHNLSEDQFRKMLAGWDMVNEFRQKKYLTLYCKKYENSI